MKPAFRTRLVDSVAASLQSEIAEGRWSRGQRIPNESTLADLLSVSRGTIREAVRILVSKGLLDPRQGSGTYVLSTTDPSVSLKRVLCTGLHDQWEVRAALYVEAARLAASRRTQAALNNLRQMLADRGSVADGEINAFIRRDAAFHKSVVAASGNKAMIELYELFTDAIIGAVRGARESNCPEPDQQAHAAIVYAIALGDPERAANAARVFSASACAERPF